MYISLTPELEARIKEKVSSGLYNNASEVVCEALRFKENHEEWVYEMKLSKPKRHLIIGVDQLTQKNGNTINTNDALDRLFDDIKS